MSFLKRIKNLWAWSKIEPRQQPVTTPFKGFDNMKVQEGSYGVTITENPRPMATIIKLEATDTLEAALTAINPEQLDGE